MIILTAGQKGGTGKSTLAANLAVMFQRSQRQIVLVDADASQPTLSYWANRRVKSGFDSITCVAKAGDLSATLTDFSQRYDVVLCDIVGQAGDELLSGLSVADVLISPVRPSQPDIETLRYLREAVRHQRTINPTLQTLVVVSQAPTHHLLTHTHDARELISELETLHLATTVIHHRTAYIDAMNAGQGVIELRHATAATEEISNLYNELLAVDQRRQPLPLSAVANSRE